MKYNDLRKSKDAYVFCLSIDLIESTERGLKFTTTELDRFNRSLVEQIKPHLKNLGLDDILIKFTGDGWLLMTDDEKKVPALCCLATIMANRFQHEMNQKTGISAEYIAPLRIAICAGRDIRIELPNGSEDWVGDSARIATRASGYCMPNEILIDYIIYRYIIRDFTHRRLDLLSRPLKYRPKREEEELVLYILEDMKLGAGKDSEAPECFIYTLSVLGKRKEVKISAQQVAKRLTNEAIYLDKIGDKKRLEINLRSWNRVITSLLDYSSALKMLRSMQNAGISPDVVTYNTLIGKAPDYETSRSWLDKMREEGILPDVVTYSTLVGKTPDYDTSRSWLDNMREEGILPDVVTYNTLIGKAPDYETSRSWLHNMREEGILPDVVTYNTLVGKAPDYETARSWLDNMREEGIEPNVVTYNTLVDKAPDYETARSWVDRMSKVGIKPDACTYNTLFSKDLSEKLADDILQWYLSQQYHPEEPIQAAIASYRKSGFINQCLRLALDYPHLQAARKLIRKHPNEAITYFKGISESDPQHPNADYALAVSLMELGKKQEALPHLKKALKLAKHKSRKSVIKEWLRQIDHK